MKLRRMGHPLLWLGERASPFPLSQGRDMGHPLLWLGRFAGLDFWLWCNYFLRFFLLILPGWRMPLPWAKKLAVQPSMWT